MLYDAKKYEDEAKELNRAVIRHALIRSPLFLLAGVAGAAIAAIMLLLGVVGLGLTGATLALGMITHSVSLSFYATIFGINLVTATLIRITTGSWLGIPSK